jgi:phosphate acetyltransferase
MTDQASPFLSQSVPVCPPELLAQAKGCETPRVAIANAGAKIPMQAAFEATNLGIMTPVFTGDKATITQIAEQLNWDISAFPILEAASEAAAGGAAAQACGQGHADILMKGDIHSDTFLKAALATDAGLRTGARLVHIFHMTHPNGGRPLLISDGAVNVTPDIATRQTAAREMVDLLHVLGTLRPRIAFLSATETPIPSVPSSLEARELCEWSRANIPDADFSGPLALDLVLSEQASRVKGLQDDPVAGLADGVIVPDIVSGNVLFKSFVYLTGACAAGLITGAKAPLLLTSRADPPAARLASIALAVVASSKGKTPKQKAPAS